MSYKNRNISEKGFTLIELTIVMLISGLILVALTSAYLRWNDVLKATKTKENISIITDAISAYASRNFRIPCPADPRDVGAATRGPEPFGVERGSGANGDQLPVGGGCPAINAAANGAEGIVPFASLGIPADIIRDGWGNYFTYQVSPIFTRDPEDTTIRVHARCRTTDWVEGTVLVGGVFDGGRNIAPLKARFCCPEDVVIGGAATRTQIFSNPIGAVSPSSSLVFNPDPNTWYEETDEVADHNDVTDVVANGGGSQEFYDPIIYGGTFAVSGHTDMPVYALISHGRNGAFAFLENSIARAPGVLTSSEEANGNPASQNVYDLPHDDRDGVNYYDDIVSWSTQTDLMARLRGDTCAAP